MKTKIIILLLVVAASVETLCADSGTWGENLTWNFANGVLTISGIGPMERRNYNNYYPWFGLSENITHVIIKDGVTSIGKNAFNNYNNLISVDIGDGVTSIEDFAFCKSSKIESLIMGNSVTSIGSGAFSLCRNLSFVKAPAIFFNNAYTHYAHLMMPDTIDVTLPTHIQNIIVNTGEITETGCDAIAKSCRTLISLDLTCVTNTVLPDLALKGCYELQTISLPIGLTKIGYMAVAECVKLQEIDIPASVIEIEDRAFENCRSSKSITFAENPQLQRIGNWAFYNCHELQNLEIPEGVTEIGGGAFYGCTYLEDLSLPSSVQTIGDNTFALCAKMKKMVVNALVPPTTQTKTFFEVDRQTPVYVPCEAIDAYKQAEQWSDFENIYAIGYVDYSCSVTSADENQGMVTITDEKIDCEKTISFRADANEDYQFKQWSDGNTDNPRTIVLTQNTTLTAIFEPKGPTDLEEIEETIQPQKILKDNHIFILRRDHIFDTQGKMVR